MTRAETAALTDAMLHSGEVLDLFRLPKEGRQAFDRRCGRQDVADPRAVRGGGGLTVPMISGRGLGHTGGTLDKLEAIPGFNMNLSVARFREVLELADVSMIGQTAEIAPPTESFTRCAMSPARSKVPYLICASIMSKKLAEGIDALVLDVKTGSGAFMKTREGRRLPGRVDGRDRRAHGQENGRADHRHGSAARAHCRERARGGRSASKFCGRGSRRFARIVHGTGGVDVSIWVSKRRRSAKGKQLAAKLIRSGGALEKFREMVRTAGRRSTSD